MKDWCFFKMMLFVVVFVQVILSVSGLTSKTKQDCDRSPIGLQDRNIVPDGRFIASSYYNQRLVSDTRYKPSSARLNGIYGWAPETNIDPQDYLQIDLGKERRVCGIATQGNSATNEWVTRYKLRFSLDGVVWNAYQENNEDKTFQGNEDKSSVVTQYLQHIKPVRYIRFIPTNFEVYKTVRLEIYASDLGPSCSPNITSVKSVNSTSIRVHWSLLPNKPCLNGILRGYKIAYKTFNETMLHFVNISNPSTNTKLLSGLRKYTKYYIHVLGFIVEDGASSEVSTIITLEDVPECSPVITNIEAATSTSIRVAWQQSFVCLHGILRGYIIQYSIFGNSTSQSINITSDRMSITKTVTGLRKYTKYSIRILAYTIGEGPMSNASVVRTAEDAPTCSPMLLSADTLSSTSVRLTWKPPPDNACRNGKLRGYLIGYRSSEGGEENTFRINDANATTHVLGGLYPYTWYTFFVLAFTVTDGTWSNMVENRTGEDAPACSPILTSIRNISSKWINVSWSPPPRGKCRNGILRGYRLFYTNTRTRERLVMSMSDNVTTTVNVTGLSKYTEYIFRILAYTVKDGLLSEEMRGTTSEDVPDCFPHLKSAEALSSTSVRVSWDPLLTFPCTNGIVRGYKLKYKRLGGNIQTLEISNGDANAANVTGLEKFTLYEFQVLVYTIKDGPLSNIILSAATEEDAPACSPTLTSIRNISSKWINVSWSPPPRGKCRNGILRGYRLFYTNTRTRERLIMNISDNVTTTVNVTGLSKYTEYIFRILAYTVKDGLLSEEMRGTTSEDAPDCFPHLKSTVALSSTSIRVSWDPLLASPCTNGLVRGYKIKYGFLNGNLETFIISNGGATSANVIGLKKFTFYEFQVLAFTVKDGPPSKILFATTKADAPSTPVNVNRILVPSNGSKGPRVEITWDEPCEKNGVINKYTLVYQYNNDTSTDKQIVIPGKGQRTHVYTIDVLGESTFSFKINAHTIEDGPYQKGKDLIIPAYPPSIAPRNLSSKAIGTSFLLQWSPIPRHLSNGNVAKYEVRWTSLSRIHTLRARRYAIEKTKNASTQETQYRITGLLSCSQYSVSVRAYTSAGPGPFSTSIRINTSEPESPYGVSVTQTKTTRVLLEWKKPSNVIERINTYTIEYKGHKTYNNYKTKGVATIQDGRTELWVKNLIPATDYELWVSALTACGKSPKSNPAATTTHITNPLAPEIATIQQYHGTNVTVNVTLFPSVQMNGPISAYQVIVQSLRKGRKEFSFDRLPSNYEQNVFNYFKAAKNNLDYYVTAEVTSGWLRSPKELMIGNNMTYNEFMNVPLTKGSRYHIYQRAFTNVKGMLLYSKEALVANVSVAFEVVEGKKGHLQDNSGSETLIGGIVGLFLLLILVIVVGYFVWKWQTKVKKRSINQNTSLPLIVSPPEQEKSTGDKDPPQSPVEEKVIKPIHVTKFAEYITSMKEDDFSQLINQYKMVPSTHMFSTITAKKPGNRVKNRYGNIVPYDHSRVPLQCSNGDEDSDYINASFMHGYDGSQKTYIASQGPTSETINDFWRMIWEQNTSNIVMLTNLVELGKRKCHQYWPDDSDQYEDITIQNHQTEDFADYHIRTLFLSKGTTEKISRRVQLFHFIAWPDKGVPQNATALLSFRRKVREMSKWNTGPCVIHCSAGVGRTGTYMIIDAMLEQVEIKGTIDIYNYLKVLRRNRPYMVQTSEQYVFIHKVLFEAIVCGNTEIQVHNLDTAMENLAAKDNEHGLSGYAIEFQQLDFFSLYGMPEKCDVGQDEENIKKNRYQNIVAADRCRVILSTDDSNQGDYINATFIDTYREQNAFIMTQAPMENTIADFWRMVMDYSIGTIVMLNNLQEECDTFPTYWPDKGVVLYNGIEIELLETEKYEDIILHKIRVSYQSVYNNVQHLQYTAWKNNFVPNKLQSFLELFEKVWKSQQKCDNNPVVVHCSNGVGRSGTFCAIASCLERVKQEQVLDVFQTVKSIRVNRPGAVETLSQYEYCYSALKEYINSFSDYANFTGN